MLNFRGRCRFRWFVDGLVTSIAASNALFDFGATRNSNQLEGSRASTGLCVDVSSGVIT